MPTTNESLLSHIIKIKDLVFELDRERESSVSEVREIALKLQVELAALSVVVDSTKETQSRLENKEIKRLTKEINILKEKITDIEKNEVAASAKEQAEAGQAGNDVKTAESNNKHAFRMEALKLLGTGAAGGGVMKLLGLLTG